MSKASRAKASPMPEHEAEHHAENGGALRARLDLRRAARGTKERGVRGLQRLHGAQLLLVLDQSERRERRALEPRLLELVDPTAKLLAGSDERCRVELSPVRDELLRMERRKPRGRLLVAVGDVEVEDVRVGRGSNECAAEERAGGRAPGSWPPRRPDSRRPATSRSASASARSAADPGRRSRDPGSP